MAAVSAVGANGVLTVEDRTAGFALAGRNLRNSSPRLSDYLYTSAPARKILENRLAFCRSFIIMFAAGVKAAPAADRANFTERGLAMGTDNGGRMLIGDWQPPAQGGQTTAVLEEDAPEAGEYKAVAREERALRDLNAVVAGGVTYYRCGGGYRVVRKRIGGV